MERSAALDLSRFIAAMVVLSGHLLFIPKSMNWSDSTILFLSPIRTGDTAVLFFFALSGYVLSIGFTSSSYFTWVTGRIVRLYPVYIASWGLGFLLLALHKPELLTPNVVLLGVIGFQSLNPDLMLTVNSPLWSLSVEIIIAFILFFFIKFKSKLFANLVFCIFVFALWMNFEWSPILRAVPFFILGILLSTEKIKSVFIHSRASLFLVLLFSVFYIFRGATWLVELPHSLVGDISKMIIVLVSIFLLSRIKMSVKFSNLAVSLGKRSFCLYAFHYPILLSVNYFIEPATFTSFAIYAFLALVGTFVCAEFAFRHIELPSMAKSREVTRRPPRP